jgi:Fe-S-cluster-containing dehydrogenase component
MNNKRFDLDIDRCVGCYACVIACKDQNIVDPLDDTTEFREVLSLGNEPYSKEKISYISLACMHCEDSPCVMACPTGAIKKDEATQMVLVNQSLCIGCHSCAMSCPNGAPKFDTDGKMQKCEGCIERTESGLIPACVRVCPTKALKYDTEDNLNTLKKKHMLRKIILDES